MALSDSMFLFEIVLKGIKSYREDKKIRVTAQFSNVFNMTLRNPKTASRSTKLEKIKLNQKHKVRKNNISIQKSLGHKARTGESIIIISKLAVLLSNMQKYPLIISVWRDNDLDCKLGSTVLPWNKIYTNYLSNIQKNPETVRPYSEGFYSVYDESCTKRILSLEMSMKLTYLHNKIISQFRSISQDMANFMYTNIISKQNVVLSTVKKTKSNDQIYNVCSTKVKFPITKNRKKPMIMERKQEMSIISQTKVLSPNTIKSDSKIAHEEQKNINRTMSCSSFYNKRKKALKYIFGDPNGSFGNQVYYVGYFAVKNNNSSRNSTKVSDDETLQKPSEPIKKFKLKKCDTECKERRGVSSNSEISINLSEEAAKINVTKCHEIDCNERDHRKLPTPPDERILLDLSNIRNECCNGNKTEEKIEEVIGGLTAKMKIGNDPCFCTCECTFGFTKKTTYCHVCGGYEVAGDELAKKTILEMPIPCPIFHKIIDKNKLKTWSTSGSESRKKIDDQKILKVSSSQKAVASDKRFTVTEKKSVESEKDSKKGKKKKKDERFKFNYGYKAPQIGHSKCALPCSGTLDNVPKNMGWLWTAENVPGLKFRPMWKPGATNKHVVRLLKIAKNPDEMKSKKKRKDTNKRKRPLKRPLLIVHKKDGEYTVTMETMKMYSKPRALNQHPYEDKPVVTYTIGRTDEENKKRLKKKERERRRLERDQRRFIQSAFKDMCHEICLKTYQQALGILPDTEDPDCSCYPAIPNEKIANMDLSCSCSEDKSSIGSDTDSDEWIVEFTPPNAVFDPTYKGKKVFKVDNGSQYTYLDYRVKLVDRFGNPVPRFFKGPDGKQQCSDLGGFWSPDHKWLEINIDGYIAPDGRWAPNIFIGPNGEQVDAETGKFQAMNGRWLVVGVDGYIDCNGRWKYYPAAARSSKKKRRGDLVKKGKSGEYKYIKSETSWSCFGDVSPKQLSKLGIVGHGGDRKLLTSTLQDMLARGEDVNIPQPKTIFHLPFTKKRKMLLKDSNKRYVSLEEKGKCHHPMPSDKGIVAVDAYGNKTYFKLKNRKNLRPRERLSALADQGISLSSFHVNRDWKPGAVSKRLLRMLNKAKLRKSNVEAIKRTKRTKKKIEDKPTLKVSKVDGKYHIEMQVTPYKSEENTEQYKPLIYEIESINNIYKVKQKERLQRRLVRAAVNKVWSDPYHPNACENICLNTYKQAVGILPLEENCKATTKEEEIETINSFSCDDDEVSLSCTSSEVNWEIHFTPPLVRYQALNKEKKNELFANFV
ncbi:unnamed protein product [Euphydryas editha]|uniref:DUF4776 domain-containing protein n=1 Tax=Euphydryas editha TaxID=104508 RepID=A0AAU9THC0_EUPED|nr:unnamed protein product [Euphydryas editha]